MLETLTIYNKNYKLRKYRILEIINTENDADKARFLRKEIPKNLKLTKYEWSRILNAPIYSKQDVGAIKLIKIADHLGKDVKDIINVPLNTKKLIKNNKDNIIEETGLTK